MLYAINIICIYALYLTALIRIPFFDMAISPGEMSQTVPTVTALNIFPIKSCRAVRVDEIEIDSYGVVGDRRFMLVDGNGRFVSQRKFSKLATVSAKFVQEGGRKLLHVSAPGMEKDLKFEPKLEGERMDVSIWESQVRAINQGDVPAQWFNTFIGHGSMFYRLVASAELSSSSSSGDGFHRFVENLPPGLKERLPPMQLALADAGPVSLISEESLADLNQRLKERVGSEVPLNRFRMNIELSGCSKPFEEDGWLLVRIGSVPLLSYTNAEVTCCTISNETHAVYVVD